VQTYASATSPWHVFPPSELDDSGCAYVWLVNPSGGLVGGDQVWLEATLAADSHVLMTTPSATRVYRTLEAPVEQEIRLTVGPNARLEWLPEVTIPFADSKFRQTLRVDLAEGATALVWDAMASGRVARNERWSFASFENEIRITTTSGASVLERFRLEPSSAGNGASLATRWDYVASAFVIGDRVSPEVWSGLEEALAVILDRWPGLVLGGVSETAVRGLAIKILSRNAPGLTVALEAVWKIVRENLWQLPPVALRRY
jgi:urease accessory protein